MAYLYALLVAWALLIVYGLSHDIRRWWFERRARRAQAREQARKDLAESYRAVIH